MHPRFQKMVESLHPSYEALVNQPPITWDCLADLPLNGVYLFSEKGKHLYVGRSNKLKKRYKQHCRNLSHYSGSFAFLLTKQATEKQGRRNALMEDEDFREAFRKTQDRIQKMEYRWVEETHQTRQALLEIYCATVLETPYNKFDTH